MKSRLTLPSFIVERTSPRTSPVKSVRSHATGKKTQFTLPNQTTWQVTAQKKAEVGDDSNKTAPSQSTPDVPLSSELVDIRSAQNNDICYLNVHCFDSGEKQQQFPFFFL